MNIQIKQIVQAALHHESINQPLEAPTDEVLHQALIEIEARAIARLDERERLALASYLRCKVAEFYLGRKNGTY